MAVRSAQREQQATGMAQAGMAAGSYYRLGQLERVEGLGWLGERCIFLEQQSLHHPRVTPVLKSWGENCGVNGYIYTDTVG